MGPKTDFPPVRACLFDMDGLLIDTEDIYTLCINIILAEHNRPSLPWSIKARLQGRPGPEANALFHEWARLPLSDAEYLARFSALQAEHFPSARPLPGVAELLAALGRTRLWDRDRDAAAAGRAGGEEEEEEEEGSSPRRRRVHIALATSSNSANFRRKTDHLAGLFSVFEAPRRVLGDDARIGAGRGKPLPHIYLVALGAINDGLPPGERPVTPEECLVFEDSVPGVESGRRAGMRVVWCPHPKLKEHYAGREKEVLAGRTGEAGDVDLHQLGEIDDGWADYMESLEDFPYEKYGIVVPPAEAEDDPGMKAALEIPQAHKI